MPDLTPKQARFVEEYLIDLNATQAAIRAGYSAKNADKIGSEVLGKTRVAEAVAEAQAARSERAEITQDMVLRELGLLGFSNMLDYVEVQKDGTAYVDLSELTRDQAAAITEATVEEYTEGRGEDARNVKRVKIKLADKKGALVDIGKHLGMFDDKLRLTDADGNKLEFTVNLVKPKE